MWYCSCGRCATLVLRLLLLCRVWCRGCCRCAMVIAPCGCYGRHFCATCGIAVIVALHWCCGCHRCTMRGVAGAIAAPCMVLWVPSLCHMWCCGCHHCATCGVAGAIAALCVVSQVVSSCHDGVTVVVIVPHVVLQLLSSHRAWCRRCCHCAAPSVTDAIVMLCLVLQMLLSCCGGVVIVVVAPRGCRSQRCAACGVVVLCVVSWLQSLRRVWFRGYGRCAAWVSPSLSLHCVWFHSRSCCAICGVACGVAGAIVGTVAMCAFAVMVAGSERRGWTHVCWQGRW
jgi:hypothetical protein